MKKERIANDSVNCALGFINGMIFSIPIWGLIYFIIRIFF